MEDLLRLQLLDPTTDRHLFETAYGWRKAKKHLSPPRIDFETFTDTDPTHLTVGLFNGDLLAIYFLQEWQPRHFEAHFTSRPLVSVVHYCHEKRDLQLGRVQQFTSNIEEILLDPPRGIHEELAQVTPSDNRATDKGHGSQLCGGVQATRETDSDTVRDMRVSSLSNAPRKLQQATECSMALSAMPSSATCNCRRIAQQRLRETLLWGGQQVLDLILSNGGEEVSALILPVNRPLQRFVKEVGMSYIATVNILHCVDGAKRDSIADGATSTTFIKYAKRV